VLGLIDAGLIACCLRAFVPLWSGCGLCHRGKCYSTVWQIWHWRALCRNKTAILSHCPFG